MNKLQSVSNHLHQQMTGAEFLSKQIICKENKFQFGTISQSERKNQMMIKENNSLRNTIQRIKFLEEDQQEQTNIKTDQLQKEYQINLENPQFQDLYLYLLDKQIKEQ